MWLETVTSVAPTSEPLDVDALKIALSVDTSDWDALIEGYAATARAAVEGRTGTRMMTQTVVMRTDDWADLANLPVAPLSSITSITYTDTDGVSQTLATTVYEARLYGLSPAVVLKYNQVWPTARVGSLIVVTAVAGYGTAEDVPNECKQAMALMVGDMLAHRETAQVGSVASVIPSSAGVDALLANRTRFL